MKSLEKVFTYLIVALCFSQVSYASEADSKVAGNTDLKTGDEIIFLEEDEPVKAGGPQTFEQKATAPAANRAASPKEATPSEAKDSTPKPYTYDPKAAEVNDRVNKQNTETGVANRRKEEIKIENTKPIAPVETKAEPKTETKIETKAEMKPVETTRTQSPAPAVNPMSTEVDKVLKDVTKPSVETKDYKKTVDAVGDVISSNKLSKEESEKIATSTQNIVTEYNKKIENAKSEDEKSTLAKEASKKINDTIKQASNEAYNMVKDAEKVTIEDQKNEKLRVVVEVDPKEKEEEIKEKTSKIPETKSKALSRSPRLSQEKEETPAYPMIILIIGLIILTIVIAFVVSLRGRDRKAKKRR